MVTPHLTKHASQRIKDRGISSEAIDLALTWGIPYQAGQGAMAYHLNRKAIQHAQFNLDEYDDESVELDPRSQCDLDHYCNVCVVMQRNSVLTVMHTSRPPRFWKECRY